MQHPSRAPICRPASTSPSSPSSRARCCVGTEPVGGAFVRLLDSTGEFTAEVVTSPAGDFRFYAAPGSWTVRALSRAGNGSAIVGTTTGVYSVDVLVG